MKVSRVFGVLPSAVVMAVLTAVGCSDLKAPLEPSILNSRAGSSASPVEFLYYHMNEPVLLDVDPSQVVLEPTALFAASEDVRRAFPALEEGQPSLERLQNPKLWRARFPVAGERVRAILSRLRADAGLSFVSEVFTSRVGGHPFIPTNFITVRFKDGTSSRQIDSLALAVGLRLLRRPDPDRAMLSYGFAYPRGAVPLKVAAALARQPLVEWADPGEYNPGQDASAPNDPFYALQYYLENAQVHHGVPVDIAVEGAWTLTTGGGVPVAVLDQGVEIGHPDLCAPPYVGFDAYGTDPDPHSEFFPNPHDDHGTNVAGIIAACRDNSVGMAGVAPSAVLMIARIKRLGVMIGPDTVAMAINWAWVSGAWVINLSWNMPNPHAVVTEAINNAETRGRNGKGTIVVGAAGNTSDLGRGIIGDVWYPATLPSVIAVGAMDRYGETTNMRLRGQWT